MLKQYIPQDTMAHLRRSRQFFLTKRPIQFILSVLKRMNEPFFTGIAAELGFFFLFSIVPLIIIFTEIMGIFSLSIDTIKDLIREYTAPEFAETIFSYLSYRPSGTINLIFIVLALWAASKAQYAMIRITNYSYGHENHGIRNFIHERLRSIITVVTMIIMIVFMLIILVYGEGIVHVLELYLNRYLNFDFKLSGFWYLLRWPASFAIIFITVLYNYAVIPTKKPGIKKVIPGSIFATAAMIISSAAYSYYVSVYANYNLLYGSLAAIVSLLLWFYILGYILVLGIQINVTFLDFSKKKKG